MKFNKHFDSYDDNAIVQKKVAQRLRQYLERLPQKPETILEIGCGTGIFTKELCSFFPKANLTLNDIFDTRKFLEALPYENFLVQNAETLHLESQDLITSSGSFQWFSDLPKFIHRISKHSNQIVFSMFLEDNLKEIKEHFNLSLDYANVSEIINLLRRLYSHVEYEEEVFTLDFPSPLAALRHLQATGVTGIGSTNIAKIRSYPYKSLTYRVGYFLVYR